ncbi:MAG: hypothetical protein IKI66_04205 [Bacteroidales bacterium]|nr:hypothetical protein [Bacteroidales bacterium]
MAGEIDQLNFKVILDDDEFNKKIQNDIAAAQKLNTSVSTLLSAKKKIQQADAARQKSVAAALKEATAEERLALAKQKTATETARTAKETQRAALAQQKVATEAARAEKAQIQAAAAARKGEQALQGQSRLFREIAGIAAGYLSLRGAGDFLSSLVDVTGEFETQKAALSAMLQDAPAAEALIEKVRSLALVSPFTFSELVKDVKQLSAYGIPVGDLYDDTKMLADVAAGLGVDIQRLILAYGQIRSATVLRGQELRQLTEAGVPIMDELAKKLSEVEGRFVAVGEVFDRVSKRQVSFEMVREVLQDLTSEGGKFYNMQEVLAQTLEGKISNLKDAYQDMLRTIGENSSDKLKGAVDFGRKLVENYQAIGKALVGLVTAYGSYKAALIAVAAWQKLGALVENIRLIGMMRKELGLLTATQQAFNIASAANVYIAIGAAVLGVVAALTSFNSKQKEALQAAGDAARAYDDESKELARLIETAKDETATKRDRTQAIEKINSTYGQYLDNVVKETDSVEDLARAYDKATAAMRAKYLEEQHQTMTGEQQTSLNTATAQMWGRIEKIVGGAGLSDQARGAVIGRLQDQLNRYGGTWNALDIYNAVVGAIAQQGGKKPGGHALGNLYGDIWDFKEAQADLNRAEAAYSAFSVGFAKATATAATAASSGADQILIKADAVAEGIRSLTASITDLERKAKADGLTEAEVKTLQQLRQDLQEQQQAYKDLTGANYGSRGSGTSATKYEQQTDDFYNRLRRAVVGYEQEIAAAQVEAMEDGQEKSLAQVELEHQKREQALIENYQKELQTLEREEAAAGRKFDPETNPRAQALLNAYKQAFLAEAMVTANAYAAIDKAAADEAEKNRLDYLEKFGTMEEKRLAIVEKYEKAIQKARAAGDEFRAKTLEKEQERDLYELQKEYSGLFALIFADAEKLTRAQLAKAIEATQDEIGKAVDSGDIQRLTELYARLWKQMEVQTSRDNWGFAGLAKGFQMMKEGREEFDAATDGQSKDAALAKQSAGADLLKKSANEISDSVSELGQALSKFEGTLGEIGGLLSGLASNTDNIVTAFTSQDKGQIIAAGISSTVQLVSLVANQIDENRKAQEAWNLTVKQCAHEYAMLQLEAKAYKEANVFGVENPYSKAIAGMSQYTAALDMIREAEAALMEGQVQTGTKKAVSGKNIGAGIAAGAGLGAAIGTAVGGWAAGLGTIIGTAIGAVVGGIVGLVGGMKEVPVYENLLTKYGSILDKNNKQNPFALNPQILADYAKLDEATKQLVDNWKEIEETANKALDELRDNFKELCGDIGNQLRDTLVEAWRNRDLYAAVDEFHDYMGGVIEDILEQLVFAATMQPLFDQLQKEMEASFLPGGDQDITDDLAKFANALPANLEAFAAAMEQARAEMEAYGFNLWQAANDSAANLAGGIKSITEDTANLIASYVNAIRADVSYIRVMQGPGWENVKQIRALMPPPSVWELIAKIEAHTANTERHALALVQRADNVLSTLKDVITTEDGAPSFRASMQ